MCAARGSVVGQGLGNRGEDLIAVTLQAPGAEALDSRKLLQRDGRRRGDGLQDCVTDDGLGLSVAPGPVLAPLTEERFRPRLAGPFPRAGGPTGFGGGRW